jgi:hypothetical protein
MHWSRPGAMRVLEQTGRDACTGADRARCMHCHATRLHGQPRQRYLGGMPALYGQLYGQLCGQLLWAAIRAAIMGSYTSSYTGSYTGSYMGSYVGSYVGSYMGSYMVSYTGSYMGIWAAIRAAIRMHAMPLDTGTYNTHHSMRQIHATHNPTCNLSCRSRHIQHTPQHATDTYYTQLNMQLELCCTHRN